MKLALDIILNTLYLEKRNYLELKKRQKQMKLVKMYRI